MSCGIEPDEEGSTGLRLTARGSVTTCIYHVDTDGRTHFNSVRWKKFLDGKNLCVGHANLITISRSSLLLMLPCVHPRREVWIILSVPGCSLFAIFFVSAWFLPWPFYLNIVILLVILQEYYFFQVILLSKIDSEAPTFLYIIKTRSFVSGESMNTLLEYKNK